MFNEAALGRHDAVLGGIGSGSPMRDPYTESSSRLFDDLTHQNDIDDGPKGEKRSPPRSRPGLAPGSTPWAEDEEMDLFFDGEPDEEPKAESQN
jgi:histone demethylase JARID1